MSQGPNEALRFERLRAQDGKPLLPPPAIQPLCRDGSLDPAQLGEATRKWQAAQDELRTMPSYPAEERLFWTTFLLARYYAEQGQRAQVPGIVEPSLPLLQQARHQQLLLGTLARNAAAMGDLDGAAQLLPRLDPASEDLQVDTNYRFTTAYVALLRGDFRVVLSVLGTDIDDVPLSDAFDLVCGVFRAHAHERLGNLAVAQQQLQRLATSPEELRGMQQIVASNPQLGLVPGSLPAVAQQVGELHENLLVTDSGIKIGRMIGVPMIGSLLAVAAAGIASEMLDPPLSEWVPGAVITVVTLAIVLSSFGGVTKPAAQRKRLMDVGVEGVARLLVVEQTGTRVNGQPMLQLRMVVTLPGQPPYSVLHKEIVPQIQLAQVQPGATLRVRVDPADRRQMAVAWQ